MDTQKAKKGDVSIFEQEGYLRLRWRHLGKRYTLATGFRVDTPDALKLVEALAVKIKRDIDAGHFTGLDTYRVPKEKPKTELSPVEVFEKYFAAKSIDLASDTKRWYRAILIDLKNGLTPANYLTVLSGNTPATIKRKIQAIGNAYKFLEIEDPFAKVRIKVPPKLASQPFTKDEVKLILEGFANRSPHYLPYVQFLLSTGVRVQEARNLKWDAISEDFTKCQVLDYKRNKLRYFQLPTMAINALKSLPNIRTTEYVFVNSKGKRINQDDFRKNFWAKVLEEQGVEYRVPYKLRGTAISHALDAGMSPLLVSQITGHTVQTLYESYAGYISSNPVMLDLF